MTLVQDSEAFRIYVNPGSENDGYEAPEWRREIQPHAWHGGRGEWAYVGSGGDSDEEPEVVHMFRFGVEDVERLRQTS